MNYFENLINKYDTELQNILIKNKDKIINLDNENEIKIVIKTADLLDTLPKFEVEDLKSKKIEDIEGKTFLQRRMKNLSEIEDIMYENMLESYLVDTKNKKQLSLDIIENKLLVEKKAKRIENKQLIFILLDISNSMQYLTRYTNLESWIENKSKINIAFGVILNRLNSVIKNYCNLYICKFEETIRSIENIDSIEKIENEILFFNPRNFDGSSTNIQNCIIDAVKFMNKIEGKKPELILISDGFDWVDYFELNKYLINIKFHAIMLQSFNIELRNLAKEHNGIYINIDRYGNEILLGQEKKFTFYQER